MLGKLSFAQHAVAGVIVLVGCIGWIFALHQTQELNAAESQLERLASVEATLFQVELDLGTAQVERDRLQLEAELNTDKSASLQTEIQACQAELEALQANAAEPLFGDSTLRFKTRVRARVRAEPNTDSDEVAVVPAGKAIQVFESVEGGDWYRVGGMGYIFHELLEPVEETEQPNLAGTMCWRLRQVENRESTPKECQPHHRGGVLAATSLI